eukprot:CAMPEP_0195582402 /NCGR_PEP_ID=MMETSP0814-20130614/22165_1 /TAXON_ID=97485 /ORGANISM="Prymnesium parvum, Strain Texoma1" /LENGTH=142 /DNA_ID=CAMNT_0040719989 /DNA_START=613 /DNA_END=1039 /DNA_ORIENTATION=-
MRKRIGNIRKFGDRALELKCVTDLKRGDVLTHFPLWVLLDHQLKVSYCRMEGVYGRTTTPLVPSSFSFPMNARVTRHDATSMPAAACTSGNVNRSRFVLWVSCSTLNTLSGRHSAGLSAAGGLSSSYIESMLIQLHSVAEAA